MTLALDDGNMNKKLILSKKKIIIFTFIEIIWKKLEKNIKKC